VLAGGLVHDGNGSAPKAVDIGVVAGTMRLLDPADHRVADRVVDVTGSVVAPGFVDIHTHSDLTLLSAPRATSKMRQGVTTEVVGNCGLGLVPRQVDRAATEAAIRDACGYLDLDDRVDTSWSSVAGYLAAVRRTGPALNVATFAAHLPIRASVLGMGDVRASRQKLVAITDLLDQALHEGAVGLSTGLVYAPLTYVDDAELVALAEVVAAHDRVMAWHVRDYADGLLPSVRQALAVAERTGCRTQISHLVAVGRRNWGSVARALELVEGATDAGLDVGVDAYPYLAGSGPLSQLLPAWAQDGGVEVVRERLADPEVRRRIRAQWVDSRVLGWEEIMVSWLPDASQNVLGRTVAALAEDRAQSPDDVVLDLVQQFGTAAIMVAHGRSGEDLASVFAHPSSVVASDGMALDPNGITGHGLTHPRSYGCFPRYLRSVDRDRLADAIRRCTAAPADRVGLHDRGRIAEGLPADLVVFRPERFADEATFEDPHRPATGLDWVLVNGRIAISPDGAEATRFGRTLVPHRAGAAT